MNTTRADFHALFPICQNGKYGFIDALGNIRLEPQFDSATGFTDGLARILVGGKWGFIDNVGTLVIPPTFDSCWAFSDGLAEVTIAGKHGFIDQEGNLRIEPKYYLCQSFEDGLAKVQETMMSKSVFIDHTGTVVLDQHDYILAHHREGLINCSTNGKWGFIDRHGVFKIGPRYAYCCPFYEGLAAICQHKDGDDYVFIDKQDNLVIDRPFKGADIRFSNDRCAVWSKRGFGFIDRAGKLVIPYRFYYADHFAEDVAVVNLGKDATYGFIDLGGEFVIKPRYWHAEAFKGGLALVTTCERPEEYSYGYIDKTGQYVWEPTR